MQLGLICFCFLAILVVTECGVVNTICKVKEDQVFEGADNIAADYVQFRLYTPKNREEFKLLFNEENILQSNYNPNLDTVFIVHGYQGSAGTTGIILMKEFTLMNRDSNVILVDWSMGSSVEYIPGAIRNTVASAREVASFIEMLMEVTGTTLDRIHLIGLSLGAQLVSFVGKKFNKIGRITALDPAGPCFSLYSNNHKIHYTDAQFVDVIITNGDGLGLKEPSGHVNFVVNGGVTQSECGATVLQNYYETFDYKILFIDSCSHRRAFQLYRDSLKSNNCPLVGYSCPSYESFLNGECNHCGRDKCAYLGYKAIEYKPKIKNETKVFYLKAAPESPYCLYHYGIAVKLGNSGYANDQQGTLYITLVGSDQEIEKLLTPYFSQSFEPGKEYTYLVTLPTDIGHITSVKLLWIRISGGRPDFHSISVDRIKVSVMNGDEHERSSVFEACDKPPLISGVQQSYQIQRNANKCL